MPKNINSSKTHSGINKMRISYNIMSIFQCTPLNSGPTLQDVEKCDVGGRWGGVLRLNESGKS